MNALNYETTKNRVGEEMVSRFENKLKFDLFSKQNELKRLEESAKLTVELPFATSPFVKEGFIRNKRELSGQLHVFQPNIWGQDFAYEKGTIDKMTVGSSYERGLTTAEMKINTPSIKVVLKRVGKNEYEYAECLMSMALIESGYVSRLSGMEMPEKIARMFDIAIMKRALKNESVLNTISKSIEFDQNDPLALLQINRTIDLTGYLQEIAEKDPYFNRRISQIKEMRLINSEESVAWEKSLIGDDYVVHLLKHLMKKRNVDPQLVSVLEKQIRGEKLKKF
jgi:hypothetical protein